MLMDSVEIHGVSNNFKDFKKQINKVYLHF